MRVPLACFALFIAASARAGAPPVVDDLAIPVRLAPGAARIVDAAGARRVSTSNARVVQPQLIGPGEVLLFARAPGEAIVTATIAGDLALTFRVTVGAQAHDAPMAAVDVQVLEINESDLLQAGVDWAQLLGGGPGSSASSAPGATSAATGATSAASGSAPAGPLNVIEVNPSMVKWGSFVRGGVDAVLDLLLTKGRAKLLAKPRLLAVSGGKAQFSSGGQLPVPVVQPGGRGEATIEWKQWGVLLEVEPKIESADAVRLKIRTEVSSVDRANAVAFAGGSVPALRNRSAESTVVMPPGSTVILAGLVQNDTSHITVGVPLLSEIPLLGVLFRHTEDRTDVTELVIFVTPTLVRP